MAWLRRTKPAEGSGWVAENRIAVGGLDTARKLIQTLSEQLRDVELDEDDIVAISLQIDYLLIALNGLSEAASNMTFDAEYEELCDDDV